MSLGDEIVSVREGILKQVKSTVSVNSGQNQALVSPSEIQMTPVVIRTSSSTLLVNILDIVPRNYVGQSVVLETRRSTYSERVEMYEQKLYVGKKCIAEGQIFKAKNKYLSLYSLLRM